MTRTVILVNRPPLDWSEGRVVRSQAGGAALAMLTLAERTDATIVSLALDQGHRTLMAEAARNGGVLVPEGGAAVRQRIVAADERAQNEFLNQFANPHVWFERHGLYERPPDADKLRRLVEGSVASVSRQLADAVVEEATAERDGERPDHVVVFVDDYQVERCMPIIRRELEARGIGLTLQHFSHIPMPELQMEDDEPFPAWLRSQQIEALLAADVVQFHHPRFAAAFLDRVQRDADPSRYRVVGAAGSVGEVLGPGARVEVLGPGGQIERQVVVEANHISIDVRRMRALRQKGSRIVATLRRELPPDVSEVILDVGRTDPSKNHVGLYKAIGLMYAEHPEYGFIPYGSLLAEHPELCGRVGDDLRDLAGLSLDEVKRHHPELPEVPYQTLRRVDPRLERHVPLKSFVQRSRSTIPEYRAYLDLMDAARDGVNRQFALPGQPEGLAPILEEQAQDQLRMSAWEQIASIIVTVSLADGYALIGLEAIESNAERMVWVASKTIGSFQGAVTHFAIGVDPTDPGSIAGGIHQALQMPEQERRQRLQGLLSYNGDHDISDWVAARAKSVARVLPPGIQWSAAQKGAVLRNPWRAIPRATPFLQHLPRGLDDPDISR